MKQIKLLLVFVLGITLMNSCVIRPIHYGGLQMYKRPYYYRLPQRHARRPLMPNHALPNNRFRK